MNEKLNEHTTQLCAWAFVTRNTRGRKDHSWYRHHQDTSATNTTVILSMLLAVPGGSRGVRQRTGACGPPQYIDHWNRLLLHHRIHSITVTSSSSWSVVCCSASLCLCPCP